MGEEGGHHRACDLTFNTYPGSTHARPADTYTHLADANTYTGTPDADAHTVALPVKLIDPTLPQARKLAGG